MWQAAQWMRHQLLGNQRVPPAGRVTKPPAGGLTGAGRSTEYCVDTVQSIHQAAIQAAGMENGRRGRQTPLYASCNVNFR